MKSMRSILVAALVCALAGGWPASAQTEPPPTGAPPAPTEEKKAKAPFGLYLEAGFGVSDGKDLDLSMSTLSSHVTTTTLSWEELSNARAAVGWKLADRKGDFRLVFNGYSEQGYGLESTGLVSQIVPGPSGTQPLFSSPIPWWDLSIHDGSLTAVRTPNTWIPGEDTDADGVLEENEPANSDTNRNGFVDPGEQTVEAADLTVTRGMADNLQNRAQHWDFLYGNNWGPPRFRGRWWAGLRYFQYDGNVLATAWLATTELGLGYTEGEFYRLLNFAQGTKGGGPTASLEAQFRFFREHLALFVMGQAAFVVLSVEAETGPFMTTVRDETGATVTVAGELSESLTKSTWQTGFEGGLRYRFDNGLELELVYNVTGYLDTVLAPTSIRIPATTSEARFGTSAIYRTQDHVFDGWRAGVSFQF
jgi:hypothetical protein